MLVIVSDLHLTDGTTGLRIPSGAFRVFRERLEDMAYDASKRDENTYEPIEEFDLVLLGDIFDLLRSTKWNNEKPGEEGYARPWMDLNDDALIRKINEIVDGILEKNAESLDVLRELANGTAISLPPSTTDKKVDRRVSRDHRSNKRVPVKVNIHYMCGNHDWLFHVKGERYDRIREKVIHHMGLNSKDYKSQFPYDAKESDKIQSIFNEHKVTARHGDKYDPFNYVEGNKKGRDYTSIGDALVIELFNPIPKLIRAEPKIQLPEKFYDDLSEMGSVRPGLLTPVWIGSLLEHYGVQPDQRKYINDIWHGLISDFLNLDIVKKLDQRKFDAVDIVQGVLSAFRFFDLTSLDNLAGPVARLKDIYDSIKGSEFGFEDPTEEDAYKTKDAKFVVFGHTHEFKVVPLRSVKKNGKAMDQFYINTGTWHPWHRPAEADSKRSRFITHKTMSYVGFYLEGERKGRSFETWTGALDL